jgi:hypothetical protein
MTQCRSQTRSVRLRSGARYRVPRCGFRLGMPPALRHRLPMLEDTDRRRSECRCEDAESDCVISHPDQESRPEHATYPLGDGRVDQLWGCCCAVRYHKLRFSITQRSFLFNCGLNIV